MWAARAIRHAMWVPGLAINALELGGIISILAHA